MAVFTERAIIYHIPKCGGTWVKAALDAAGVAYRTTRNVAGEHPFNLKVAHATPDVVVPSAKAGRFGITFVRSAEDWYRSYWAFRSRKGARRDERFPADGLWSDTFDTFVNNVLDAYPGGFVSELYQYYVGEACEKVDCIGRTEHLVDDLVVALLLAGETFDEEALRTAPRANESPARWKRQAVLTPETKARVLACERWVMETFYA